MKVTSSSGVGGKWLDKKELKTGELAKIKTEAREIPSQQEGKMQLVCKLQVQGHEEANFAINTPSKNALIHAYGDETADWVNKTVTLHTEKTLIAGKRGISVYLIPSGYQISEDAGGYLVITKIGMSSNLDEGVDISPDDIPF